jgi:hypothetical protein
MDGYMVIFLCSSFTFLVVSVLLAIGFDDPGGFE